MVPRPRGAYVRAGGAPSPDSVYILDRNHVWTGRLLPASLAALVGQGADAHLVIGPLDGEHFDWNAKMFPADSDSRTVVVNFGEDQFIDLVFDLTLGSQPIRSTIINTRYVGPLSAEGRMLAGNWTGGTTQVKSGVTFEPVNGLALAVADFEKIAGGTASSIGTAAWPALLYVANTFVKSTGNINYVGEVLALGDVSFSGTTNMDLDAGFLEELPGWLNPCAQPTTDVPPTPPITAPSGVPTLVVGAQPARGRVSLRFSIPRQSEVILQAFTVSGRRVWSWTGQASAGAHEITWSGRGSDGRLLPAGLYEVRLSAATGAAQTRLLLLR